MSPHRFFPLLGSGYRRGKVGSVGAERIGKVAGRIQRDVRGIVEPNTSAAGMKTGVEALKESVSQGTEAAEEKSGKTEKLLRLILIVATAAGAIPALIAKFLE